MALCNIGLPSCSNVKVKKFKEKPLTHCHRTNTSTFRVTNR